MASKHSYKITVENNITEKEAINYLLKQNSNFILPDKNSRKTILKYFDLDLNYIRSFDLIQSNNHSNKEKDFDLNMKDNITLIEIKSTKKKLLNNPYGFFFGATENEFSIAKKLGSNYKFCFVCLHPETLGYVMLTLEELNDIIHSKRVQYQINIKSNITTKKGLPRTMADDTIKRRLQSIGQKAFVENYKLFNEYSTGNISKEDAINKLIDLNVSNKSGAAIRLSNAKYIFDNSHVNDALLLIINSSRLSEDTILKANTLLNK